MEIPHIPHLSSFRLCQIFSGFDYTNLLGHSHFLQTNQAHLRDLEIRSSHPWYSHCPPATPEAWFKQAWCHIPLPQLRSLTLFLSQFPRHDATAATSYLVQFSQTLTTLSLKPCRFSYEAASLLFPQLVAVRTLEIFVWAMSRDLLQLFARHMPKLHSLKLNAGYYSPEKDTKITACLRIPRFCEVMKSDHFPDWQLHNFQFEPFSILHLDIRVELLGAVRVAFPRIQDFF